ncbi:coiled-coil domain-containing protein 86 [Bombyx mandarina]|uniref:Coiled-coil domain-containing protein 86 n=1 Tax=Bombyx mandarina TaxID=7092 RepID=A0A6J2K4Q2_BOMMA|nr:coiled-coil domain-containing protein 86 [Bombyx mandarina]
MADETQAKVSSIVTDITKSRDKYKEVTIANNAPVLSEKRKQEKGKTIRGIPKSGRFWKSKKEKFSSINKTKGLKQDFSKKTALRLELKRTKELSKQALEQLKEKELSRKERRRQNLKKAEENRKKSEVVQVITNTTKLKRMRKKQLRFIEKRDTNKEVESSK